MPAVTPTLTTHPDNGGRGFQAAAGAFQRFQKGNPSLPFFTSHPGEVTRGFITKKCELLPLRAKRKENCPERSDVDFDTRGVVRGREPATQAGAAWGKGGVVCDHLDRGDTDGMWDQGLPALWTCSLCLWWWPQRVSSTGGICGRSLGAREEN